MVVDVRSVSHVTATDDSVVKVLGAEVTSVPLAVAEASTAEVAEGVTLTTEPLEIERYGAGGGRGGLCRGGAAAPFEPDGGGSAEVEARPKLSTMAASVKTILGMRDWMA